MIRTVLDMQGVLGLVLMLMVVETVGGSKLREAILDQISDLNWWRSQAFR